MLIIPVITLIFACIFYVGRRRKGRWTRPWMSRYEVCEPGDLVINGRNVYIIRSVSIRTSRGSAGPCLYEVIAPDGTVGSIENWRSRRIRNECKDHE